MAVARGPGAGGRCPLLDLFFLLLIAGPALCWNDRAYPRDCKTWKKEEEFHHHQIKTSQIQIKFKARFPCPDVHSVQMKLRDDRILLRDVKVLTLHYDRYTTSRRLDPIPQLKCVGGTAGCDSYTPKVIQCQNKGWDGYDVQWECKTDLDVAFKFGKTVVSCEGYESSEDQYVLRGSCGLEYNLDYTEIGLQKLKESGKHHGFSFSDYYYKLYSADSCSIGGLVTIAVLLTIAFVVYKLFLSDSQYAPPPYSECPPYSQHYQRFTNSAGPCPPGFKSEFTGPHNTGHGTTSGFGNAFAGSQGYENSGPGFWTGLGTGGLLGYLFGSNRAATPFSNSWYYPSYPPYSSTWNSRAYSPLHGGPGSYSACLNSETKTRTASGYGGTRRR